MRTLLQTVVMLLKAIRLRGGDTPSPPPPPPGDGSYFAGSYFGRGYFGANYWR